MPSFARSAAQIVIFVIDDDPERRERLGSILSDSGYAVVPLPSLADAGVLLRRQAVCRLLILSPDALAAGQRDLDALRAHVALPPRLVVCDAGSDGRNALRGLNDRVVAFIPGPQGAEGVLEAVRDALGGEGGTAAGDGSLVASSPVSGWIELTAPSKLEHLRRLRRFSETLFASSLPAGARDELMLVVEEVGRNAMEWGNRFDPDKRVRISYCLFDDRIIIKCEDEGEGFAPQSVPDPTADPAGTMRQRQKSGKRPGGYGVYLMQKLVDDMVYSEKGNVVLMIKLLPRHADATRLIPKREAKT